MTKILKVFHSKRYFKIGQVHHLGFLVLLLSALFFNRLELLDPLAGISFSKAVYSENTKLLRLTLSDDEQYRLYSPLSDTSHHLKKAVLLSEDRYFYYHWGVNPISIFRALATLNDARPVGASTLTMQYVRLKHKMYTKSFVGKLKQMLWAGVAECLYSKNQILEAYLNLAPYGANIEGARAASLIYFKKSISQLSLEESLLLAVIPQNPLQRSLNQEKQDFVLEAQKRLAQIWEKTYSESPKSFLSGLPLVQKKIAELPFEAPHFVNFVLQQSESSRRFQGQTTLNEKLQKLIELKVKDYLRSQQAKGIRNAAVVVLDADTQAVKAWVGSGDFYNSEISGQIDGVTTLRSPGSALKPFLYGLALDEGLIHSQTLLYDTPSSFGLYDPENFDRTFKGPMSAEESLVQSRNVPAIFLASRLNKKTLFQLLSDVRAPLFFEEKYYGLGLAIGVAEISPLKLAEMYMALANQGVWQPARWNLPNQKSVQADSPRSQMLSAEASLIIRKMLQKNIRSESFLLDQVSKSHIPVSWKTGTSYGFRDAWVAGIIGRQIVVVWLGDFNNTSNPYFIGRDLAAPLFFDIVEMMNHRQWIKPENALDQLATKVKSVDVCSLSGKFSKGLCPHLKKAMIVPGVSPIDECLIHRQFLVSKKSGLRVCDVQKQSFSKSEIFEVWPSDVIQLFTKYGIPHKKIPAYEKVCDEFELSESLKPQIVSPKFDVTYAVKFTPDRHYEKIPFKAIVDQESKFVYWFANNKPLGQSKPEDVLLAELPPGHYEIMAVDDRGQVSTRDLNITVLK